MRNRTSAILSGGENTRGDPEWRHAASTESRHLQLKRTARSSSLIAILAAAAFDSSALRTVALAEEGHPTTRTSQWVGTWSASPQTGFLAE